MEVIIDSDDDRTVYVDKQDMCMWCGEQYGCPLIECLANGLVEAKEQIVVVDCPHYNMHNR